VLFKGSAFAAFIAQPLGGIVDKENQLDEKNL